MSDKPSKTRLKKKVQVEQEEQQRATRRSEQNEKKDSFIRHWERDDGPATDKKLDGNRRPKPFKYSKDVKDDSQEDEN